jgi:hypothetical protein
MAIVWRCAAQQRRTARHAARSNTNAAPSVGAATVRCVPLLAGAYAQWSSSAAGEAPTASRHYGQLPQPPPAHLASYSGASQAAPVVQPSGRSALDLRLLSPTQLSYTEPASAQRPQQARSERNEHNAQARIGPRWSTRHRNISIEPPSKLVQLREDRLIAATRIIS